MTEDKPNVSNGDVAQNGKHTPASRDDTAAAEKFKNDANDAFKGRTVPQLPAKSCVHHTHELAGGFRREKLPAGH